MEPSVFALVKSSLDCRLWQWHAYLLESVLPLAGCCERGFSLPWRGSSDHPSLLSSVDIQAFLCCWAHQCILFFFLDCTKLLIWQFLMFLLSLWWIVFCFWSLTIVCFICYGEILWPHDVGSEQQLPNMTQLESTPDPYLLNWCRNNKE